MDCRYHRPRVSTKRAAIPLALTALAVLTGPAGGQEPTALPTPTHTRVLVYSEALNTRSQTPTYVDLDSGVVYRLTATGDAGVVFLAPYSVGGPPIRFVPISGTQGSGTMFAVPYTGRYRLYASTSGTEHEGSSFILQVSIHREEGDTRELRCARQQAEPGCRARPRYTGVLLALISLPIAAIMLLR